MQAHEVKFIWDKETDGYKTKKREETKSFSLKSGWGELFILAGAEQMKDKILSQAE